LQRPEDIQNASRWGFHPSYATGQRDPATIFESLPPGYAIETYATGLVQPTGIAFLPDGTMLVSEQAGVVRIVVKGAVRSEAFYRPAVYYPRPDEGKLTELGLVSVTVDPEFERNGFVYVYYTTDQPERRTVLERLELDGRAIVSREVILSLDAAPSCCHISGSVRFFEDGTLLVAVGDHQMETASQDVSNPFGSILRIDRDGDAPPDNPLVDERGADPRIYAYGLRNPFDIARDPATGRLFATENGFIGQDAVIELEAGANYGWPGYELADPVPEIEPPLLFFHNPLGPSGIEFYRGSALEEFDGALFFCHFHRGGALHKVTFEDDGDVRDRVLATGCTTDVLTGPDGFLYFVDYVSGTVYRITRDGA
jgi:glucose/arabinose dehydrogenase